MSQSRDVHSAMFLTYSSEWYLPTCRQNYGKAWTSSGIVALDISPWKLCCYYHLGLSRSELAVQSESTGN